jgi:hypothetical protein
MRKIQCIIVVLTILIGSFSCKERTILSTELIPAVDNINTFFTDTCTMISNNEYYDSVFTSRFNAFTLYCGLGCINNDAALGKTTASFSFQVKQPQVKLRFPDDMLLDSMVFSMPFVRTYGDTISQTPQTFHLYQLNARLNKDTNYKISRRPDLAGATLIGSTTVNFAKMDSVQLRNKKEVPQMRITLDSNFAKKIRNFKDTVEYASTTSFLDSTKGFVIVPADTNVGDMIGYFNYTSLKMEMYTHRTSTADSTIYPFTFEGVTCTHHNSIRRNFTGASVQNYLNTNNPKGDSLLFVQSDFGSTLLLKFPTIGNLPKSIVNKAELEFTFVGTGDPVKDSLFRPVSLLVAHGVDANGNDYALTDDYNATFAGVSKKVNDGLRIVEYENGLPVYKYRLTLTKTFQKAILERNNNLKIRIIGVNGFIASGRSIFSGSNRISLKPKINLIYTKFK